VKHRTAVVTAASVAGVLLVGAAALGANLGVLGSPEREGLSAAGGPEVATVYVDDAATAAAVPTTTTPEVLAYNVPGVGIVTLDRSTDGLRVAGVELVSGWTSVVEREGSDVLVSLSGDRELTFSARVVDGQVAVSVDEVPAGPVVAGYDDGGEHEEYEHEEYEGRGEYGEHGENEGWGDDD